MKVQTKIMERLIPGVNRHYGEASPTLRQHLIRYRFAAAYIRKNDRVLDAACGSGYGAFILAKAGAEVVGIDCSNEAIAYANHTYNHERISWKCLRLEEYSGLSEYFHRITCFETLEHLTDPELIIRAFARMMRKDGLLLCSVPIVPTKHFDSFHLHDFDENFILDLLCSCGFHCIDRLLQESTILTIVAAMDEYPDLEPRPINSIDISGETPV